MSEQTLTAAQRIDEIAKRATEYFDQAGSMEAELRVAQAIGDMRKALTPEVMRPIMELMNHPLGFLTDRDPNRKSKNGPSEPYSMEVVRDCFIESKLRGYHSIGNEWNIIAGKCYAAVAGVERKARTWKAGTSEAVSEMRDFYEVPRMKDGGALVKCSVVWKVNGSLQKVERDLPIKTDAYTTCDAILGKARRKLFAAVLAQLSGTNIPEGDVDEIENRTAPEQIAETPQTTANWREVTIVFAGMPQLLIGKKLGALSDPGLQGLCESWTPKGTTDAELFLREALDKCAKEKGWSTPPKQ